MATTITGKLNKAANQFQAGESTGFGIRLGVKARNPKTKEDEWCNYSATIFAKSPGQIQFYQQALVEGSVVEISCDQLLIESFEGQSGTMLSINMINSRLGYVHTGQQQGQQQGQHQQAPQQQNNQQQAPQQQQYRQTPSQGGFQQQPAPQQHQQPQQQNNQQQQQGGDSYNW